MFFMHKHLRWFRQQISLATGGLSAIWAAGHENMCLYSCTYNKRGDKRSVVLEKASHNGPYNSKTVMRSLSLDWQTISFRPNSGQNECYWCRGLRKRREGLGEFDDLCLIILSALVSLSCFLLSLTSLKVVPEFLETWAIYFSSVRIFTMIFQLSQDFYHPWFFSLDKKGLSMPKRLGRECNIQDAIYCLWPGLTYMPRCIGPSFQNAEFMSQPWIFHSLLSVATALEAHLCPDGHILIPSFLIFLSNLDTVAVHLLKSHGLLFTYW